MIPTLSRMYLQPLEGTPLEGLRAWTRIGFLIGAWAVLFKTLYVATAANSRLTADFLDLTGIWRQHGPVAADAGDPAPSACSTPASRSASTSPSASPRR